MFAKLIEILFRTTAGIIFKSFKSMNEQEAGHEAEHKCGTFVKLEVTV